MMTVEELIAVLQALPATAYVIVRTEDECDVSIRAIAYEYGEALVTLEPAWWDSPYFTTDPYPAA